MIDRSDWPDGPWDGEPDSEDFEHAGLQCHLERGPLGHWCGYVAVPTDHPLHGLDYDAAHDAAEINVHWGLTYARQGFPFQLGTKAAESADWALGFDCAHCEDLIPTSAKQYAEWRLTSRDVIYRTIEFAREETKRLAEQFAALKTEGDRCMDAVRLIARGSS